MRTETFFEESKEQSEVKSAIVSKYFWVWAKVVIPSSKKHSNKIAYLDLFAGPGRYKDGTKSTPILILEKAIMDSDMRNMLVTIFNDKNSNYVDSLKNAISSLPNIDKMKYQPQINNDEVGEEVVKQFEEMRFVPTLFFVDPWGYKGLSLKLVNAVLKDWGCDCIFFFNYKRINMGLTNTSVKEHMDSLFGQERADKLRAKLNPLNAEQRELTIIEELIDALKEMGGKYILPFTFKNESGKRTNHHLIFVT
ncbi:MAG: three-Cys-motif partner protein TcmP, partial [Candidatus Margulisiibacteriota bacterium]